MRHSIRLTSILGLLMIILAGCALPATPQAETGSAEEQSVGTEADTEENTAPDTDSPAESTPEESADDAAQQVTATTLTFEGQGDTFLEYISDVESAADTITSHRYVAADGGGLAWQGEVLVTDEEAVGLFQPVGIGGSTAVELRASEPIDWSAALAETGMTMAEEVVRPEPEIRFVRARQTDNNVWSVDVTLAYPDTGWEDYVDGWHVATPDDEILATRILLHPHVNEQPFTRGQGNITVPDDVDSLVIRAHTLVRGYGSDTVTIPLQETTATDQYEVIRQE